MWLADDDVAENGDDDQNAGRDLELGCKRNKSHVQVKDRDDLLEIVQVNKGAHQIKGVAYKGVHLADGIIEGPFPSKAGPDGEPSQY